MPQYETTGGGTTVGGDRIIERKVIVSTDGPIEVPSGPGRLSNVSVTQEPGGIRRGVFEFTLGGAGETATYAANYDAYGKKIELVGGSREVPIYNHPDFADLTSEQVLEVQNAAEERPRQTTAFPNDEVMDQLYQCLIRQIEYYLAPNLVARVSEFESDLPRTDDLCKIVSNVEGVSPPGTGDWILTAINASPVGNKYEVTREYTYIDQPEAARVLYE